VTGTGSPGVFRHYSIMKKLNIVLAATGISSFACDIYLDEIAPRLRKKGHRVWLIKVNPDKRVLEKDDIPVYWQRPRLKTLWLLYVFCPYFFDRLISKLIADAIQKIEEPIDIIDFEIPSLTYCYQRKGNEKIVVRGWFYPHHLWQRLKIMWEVAPKNLLKRLTFLIRQAWYYWGDEYGFKKADAIITLTSKLASKLGKRGFVSTWVPRGIKPYWIPLGVKTRRRIKKGPTSLVRLGCVAYDLENPRKGVRFLLEAVELLDKELETPSRWPKGLLEGGGARKKLIARDSYRLELIGGYTSKLKREIENLGLSERITLLGKLNHKQVLKKLQSWDIFVFPTLFEELSMAAIEAMTAGLALVGWKVEGLKATWGNAAILIPRRDTKKLARALAKLISSPKLRERLGQKARTRARKYFDWKMVAQRLEKVYLETACQKITFSS